MERRRGHPIETDDKFKFIVRDLIESNQGDSMSVRTTTRRALKIRGMELNQAELRKAYQIVADMMEAYGGKIFWYFSRHHPDSEGPSKRVYKFESA